MQQIIEGIKLGCILLGEDGGIKLKYIIHSLCICYGNECDICNTNNECDHCNKKCPNSNLREIFIGKKGEKIKMDDIIEALNQINEYMEHYIPFFHFSPENRQVEIRWEC